jgi:Ca2+-binding RTX toxin-like protein
LKNVKKEDLTSDSFIFSIFNGLGEFADFNYLSLGALNSVSGGAGNDTLHGTNSGDWIAGFGGTNTLYANGGRDLFNGMIDGHNTVYLGDGDDIGWGGSGYDKVFGGNGSDAILAGIGNDEIYGDAGNDHLAGDAGDDTLEGGSGTDRLVGGEGNDILKGGDDDDELSGNSGNDTLEGNKGDDYLSGGEGEDNLKGGDRNDILFGGVGNDILNGGSGIDTLVGGEGDDSFDFSSLEDSSINATDLITDFEQGFDIINLSEIEEDLSFESFEFVEENGHMVIKDKNSDFAIDLNGQFNLVENDFIF